MPGLKSTDRTLLARTCRELIASAQAQATQSPRATQRAAERARVIAGVIQDKLAEAEAAMLSAAAYLKMGRLTQARERLAAAMPIFEAHAADRQLGQCYDIFTTIQLNDNYYALALAGAKRALSLRGLMPATRSKFHLCIALASCNLLDLAGARRRMTEHALPEAYASHDAEVIHMMQYMMAGLEAIHACLAGGIRIDSIVGMRRPAGMSSMQSYLDLAQRCIDEGRRYADPSNKYQSIWALDTEGWIGTLRDGIEVSRPTLEAGLALCGDQFDRVACKLKAEIGIGYRLAGRPAEALPWLLEARRLADGQQGRPMRSISFELSLVYEALGRTEEALEALRTFTELHARMAVNATSWLAERDPALPLVPAPDLILRRTAMLRPLEPHHLRRAVEYIERNLDRPIRLSELARECKVSAKTLQNAFRIYRGTNPRDAIRELRLKRAQELLRTTSLRIGDVAMRVGYSSGSNLSRDYRSHFGTAPSRARASEGMAATDLTDLETPLPSVES